MKFSVALCLLVALAGAFAAPWESIEVTEKRFERQYQFLRKLTENGVEEVESEVENVVRSVIGRRNLTMYGFSWNSCGKADDPVQIKTLAISPDPIVTPGNVQAKLDAVITRKVTSISSLAVVMKKKLFGAWIQVPCVDNVGSCTYSGICAMAEKIECPPELVKQGFTCRCPVEAKEYTVPEATFKIPDLPLPATIENGDFQVKATIMDGGSELGCFNFQFSLKKE